MKEDRFTNTPADAAAYEQYRAGDDYEEPRPTKAELDREENDELGTESDTSWCWLGSYNAHTWNYERTECIWCGPNKLAWDKSGHWVDIGNGYSAWSVAVKP